MSFIKWLFVSIIVIGIFIGLGYGIIEIVDLIKEISINGFEMEVIKEPLRGISLAALELAVLGEGYFVSREIKVE